MFCPIKLCIKLWAWIGFLDLHKVIPRRSKSPIVGLFHDGHLPLPYYHTTSCTALSAFTDGYHQSLLDTLSECVYWRASPDSAGCTGPNVSTGGHHQILLLAALVRVRILAGHQILLLAALVQVCLLAHITGVLHTYYSQSYLSMRSSFHSSTAGWRARLLKFEFEGLSKTSFPRQL